MWSVEKAGRGVNVFKGRMRSFLPRHAISDCKRLFSVLNIPVVLLRHLLFGSACHFEQAMIQIFSSYTRNDVWNATFNTPL